MRAPGSGRLALSRGSHWFTFVAGFRVFLLTP